MAGQRHLAFPNTCLSSPTPSSRGGIVLCPCAGGAVRGWAYQTPSERGCIVLLGSASAGLGAFRFKPLQNGAVLCCVSNRVTAPSPSGCFKPLQNGAVLCWGRPRPSSLSATGVSNPFRTGRYCAELVRFYDRIFSTEFQTPSERGGIVLTDGELETRIQLFSFKPLQNGAVLC